MIKLSVLKNRLSGILSVGNPDISVVSGTLSVGHPNISVVSGILSVVGIPPVPIPEEIQLLMYADLFAATSIFILEEFFFSHMLITIVFLY